jgi:hypothetical protein
MTDGRMRIDQGGTDIKGNPVDAMVEPQVGGTRKLNPCREIHGRV